jgi:colanic acid biosynthesis glycosyl transferase WcaI
VRVLILSINYWPEVTGIGAFTTYRAEHLAGAGHDVEVCTTFPYYPDWKVSSSYAGKFLTSEERKGVRIFRSYAYIPNPVTSLKRILHEGSFVISTMMRAVLRKRPDLLLVVSPPLGLAIVAILLKRLWGVPYVFDVEDLQPDSAADLGMLPSWAVNLLYRVEKAAYKHARLVTTLTSGMRKRIIEKGVAEQKVELLEPRMDDSLADILPGEGIEFRRKYGIQDELIVTHSGNMGVKQGLDVVLDAAALCRSDNSVLFLLVGNGVDRDRIQRRAAELDLRNVRFLPLLPDAEFRGLLAASDMCLVTQQRSVSDIAFPSKVVTYLAAGRPVVASVNANSEVARTVDKSGAGRVVVPEDANALRLAIDEIRCADLPELSRFARKYATLRWSSVRVLGHLERCLVEAAGLPVNSLEHEEVRR